MEMLVTTKQLYQRIQQQILENAARGIEISIRNDFSRLHIAARTEVHTWYSSTYSQAGGSMTSNTYFAKLLAELKPSVLQ